MNKKPNIIIDSDIIYDFETAISELNYIKIHINLSSSERTLLILFLSNYSESILSEILSLQDLGLIAGISEKDKIAFIVELFQKYPTLLQ